MTLMLLWVNPFYITTSSDIKEKVNNIDTITGFTAIIFQHEIDHLEGTLYIDRISDKSNLYTEEEYKNLINLLNKNSSD